MKIIDPIDFITRVNDLWHNKWLLLTSGDYEKNHANTMTVSWGYFGMMWNKPMAVVVVRPSRYTFEFMEKYDSFTLTGLPEKYKKEMLLLGSVSGRDLEKVENLELTSVPSMTVSAPSFEEADLVLECKKVYWDDFKPENFVNPSIDKNYPLKDYHRMYFGEVLNVIGAENYSVV